MRKLSEIIRTAMKLHADHSTDGCLRYMCNAFDRACNEGTLTQDEANTGIEFAMSMVRELDNKPYNTGKPSFAKTLAGAISSAGVQYDGYSELSVKAAQVWEAVVDKLEYDGN